MCIRTANSGNTHVQILKLDRVDYIRDIITHQISNFDNILLDILCTYKKYVNNTLKCNIELQIENCMSYIFINAFWYLF